MTRFAATLASAIFMTLSPGMDAFADHHEAGAQDIPASAHATLTRSDGGSAGHATFTDTPNGVLITAELSGLPAGPLGFHIHESGACAPDFSAAGGHLGSSVDGQAHGFFVADGPHSGDMANINVPESGALTVEVFNPRISFAGENALFDEDGAALVIHSGPDDYESQPSGAAGERIACGVIARSE